MTGNVIRGTADRRCEAWDLEGIATMLESRETDAPSGARPLLIRHARRDSSQNPTMQHLPCSAMAIENATSATAR